jgi:hypothetical protein
MRLNTAKTRVLSCSRTTNVLSYENQLCHAAVTRTSSNEDLGVFFDSKLYFHNNVDFLFSECIKVQDHFTNKPSILSNGLETDLGFSH